VEVLVISSRKKGPAGGALIPKGGWELLDESMDEAARREAKRRRLAWSGTPAPRWAAATTPRTRASSFVLPLRVTAELDRWPEMAARRREWVPAAQAIARCPHPWMRTSR
jgi:diphosphoinositol-polyphosphate diphosphatase